MCPSGPKYATLSISSNDKHPEISSLKIVLIFASGNKPFSLALIIFLKILVSLAGL